jgi:Ni/Co efflux regulator RcnB
MKARRWTTGGILVLFTLFCAVAGAQDHGQDQDRHDQGQRPNDQGRHDENRSNPHRDDEHGQDHSRFDDHDRQVTHDWYNEHRDHPPVGLRDHDRLPPEYESRLREGEVLDRDMRRRIHPIPADYYRRLPPPPRGYRYVFIGGHACLIDSGYRVHDVIHFELNF